jgi:hypothetical protein
LFDDKSGISELMKLKGKIVHLALQKNIKIANVKHFIEERIKNISDEVNKSSFIESVTNNISKFYDSDEFKYLDSFKSFKNEYEIYLKKSDYYLFGIIDKIIFDEQKLIIVDYKTDNIVNTQITTSGTKYLPQLKFYSYIVQRLFDKKSEIEGRVMFIKHPENPFIFTYNDVDDRNINSNLNRMIQSLRNNEYSLNLNHCKECLFADENLVCIKSRVENIK